VSRAGEARASVVEPAPSGRSDVAAPIARGAGRRRRRRDRWRGGVVRRI